MKTKTELKTWGLYFTAILIYVFIHEIGHCLPAWLNGYRAIPTPSKEYILDAVPAHLIYSVSLGGILATILTSLLIIIIFSIRTFKYGSILLAAVIAMPGMYTFRFFLAGRGHDATEFQEAQTALGLDYSGHSLDWIFLLIFVAGTIAWIVKTRPRFKSPGRIALGVILTFAFVIGLQVINNAIFDPIFLR